MKKVPFELFGIGQYLLYNVERLAEVEAALNGDIGDILNNHSLNIRNIVVFLRVGLKQHGVKNDKWFYDNIQKLMDEGHSITEFYNPVAKAVVASGFFGKAAYYGAFPEEITPEAEAEIAKESKG